MLDNKSLGPCHIVFLLVVGPPLVLAVSLKIACKTYHDLAIIHVMNVENNSHIQILRYLSMVASVPNAT